MNNTVTVKKTLKWKNNIPFEAKTLFFSKKKIKHNNNKIAKYLKTCKTSGVSE
jgi:hypothetical protein